MDNCIRVLISNFINANIQSSVFLHNSTALISEDMKTVTYDYKWEWKFRLMNIYLIYKMTNWIVVVIMLLEPHIQSVCHSVRNRRQKVLGRVIFPRSTLKKIEGNFLSLIPFCNGKAVKDCECPLWILPLQWDDRWENRVLIMAFF